MEALSSIAADSTADDSIVVEAGGGAIGRATVPAIFAETSTPIRVVSVSAHRVGVVHMLRQVVCVKG